MRTWHRLTCVVIGTALAVTALTGCESSPGHEANVNRAEERYHQVRARMMLPLARDQFRAGDLDQAERTVNEALRIDPENGDFYVLAGRIAFERGRLEYSQHAYDKAIELNPKLPSAYYYKGLVQQRWQQYPEAQQSYQRAYELEPDRPSYLLAVAEMLTAQNRVDEALAMLESKLVYFEHSAGIREAVGQLYAAQGNDAKAVGYYRQANLLDPGDNEILEKLALAELSSGNAEASIRLFQNLLAKDENRERSDLRAALGTAYAQTGRLADARAVFERMTREEPTNQRAWTQLGQTAWAQGDTSGALRSAAKITELAPNSHEGYLLAGMVWQKRGRLDRALPQFEEAAERAPENQTVLLMRGLALQEAGDRDAAAQVYRQALDLRPEDARVRRLLAQVDTEGH